MNFVRAYEGKKPYIFISYAHKDSEKVLSTVEELFQKKYRVWYDGGIPTGEVWPQYIADHLKRASCVFFFVSQNFIASENCKNEVLSAIASGCKNLVAISLDGVSRHEELSGANNFDYNETLIDDLVYEEILTNRLLGDGEDGYSDDFVPIPPNLWNILLGVGGVLFVFLGVLLYGLYSGRLDAFISERILKTEFSDPVRVIESKIEKIDPDSVPDVFPYPFMTEEEEAQILGILDFDTGSGHALTYGDLKNMTDVLELDINHEAIESIGFAVYLPNLESISIRKSSITDLSPLLNCKSLKAVGINPNLSPIEIIPSRRDFMVEVIGNDVFEFNPNIFNSDGVEPKREVLSR